MICLSALHLAIKLSNTTWNSGESNLSASSITTVLQLLKSAAFFSAKSKIRPGVPIMIAIRQVRIVMQELEINSCWAHPETIEIKEKRIRTNDDMHR